MEEKCEHRSVQRVAVLVLVLASFLGPRSRTVLAASDLDVDVTDSCQASPDPVRAHRGDRIHWHQKGQKDLDVDFDRNDSPFTSVHHYHVNKPNPHARSEPVRDNFNPPHTFKYTVKSADCVNDPTIIVDR
ncbi:MAG TPA: hypothetical protein VK473_10665 [Terriglobales bacterium]|nr:hypothetical protein [Terriglobales bacterium]